MPATYNPKEPAHGVRPSYCSRLLSLGLRRWPTLRRLGHLDFLVELHARFQEIMQQHTFEIAKSNRARKLGSNLAVSVFVRVIRVISRKQTLVPTVLLLRVARTNKTTKTPTGLKAYVDFCTSEGGSDQNQGRGA